MSAPTEPGFYWARMRSTFYANPEWEIVKLVSLGPAFGGRLVVRCIDEVDDDWSPDEDVLEWGPRIERPDEPPVMAENPLLDPITVPPGMEPGQLAVEELTRGEAVVRFAKPPPFGAVLDGIAGEVAQLVANVARERTRRLELAALRCFARDQRVEELRIHTDASGLELRAELIVEGEVAETVDLSDLHPNRLMRDSGKPPEQRDRLPDETCPLCGSRDFEQWTIGHLVSDGRDPNRRSCRQCPCQWFVDGVVGGARVVRFVRR